LGPARQAVPGDAHLPEPIEIGESGFALAPLPPAPAEGADHQEAGRYATTSNYLLKGQAFYNERADIWVDGELQPRPETPWSPPPAR
jgi:hypothetical protein